jgi:uncharacterized OB-fold protein
MTAQSETTAAKIIAGRLAPRGAARDLAFWEGCERGELHVQRCEACGETWFPSQDRCPVCQSEAIEWMPVENAGTLYTFTIIHGPGTEGRPGGLEAAYPYAVGVVEIDGGSGARIAGNIIVEPMSEIAIGMRLRAEFVDGERALPLFVREEV